MKRIKSYNLAIFIMTVILVLAGCSLTGVNTIDVKEPAKAKLTPLQMPFELETSANSEARSNMYTICYSGEDTLIVSNVYDNIVNASEIRYPKVRTNGIYVVNYKENTSSLFEIKSANLIYSAIPYDKGLIYVESGKSEECNQEVRYKWDVIYFDGTDKRVIDSGYSRNQTTTEVSMVKGIPIYVGEHLETGSTEVFVNKIVNGNKENLTTIHDTEKIGIIEDNGESYLLCLYDRQNKQTLLCAGNEDGIFLQKQIDGSFNSATINEEYIVASVGEEVDEMRIIGIPLDGSEEQELKQTKRWWRLTGSCGKICLMVDDNFNLYCVEIEDEFAGKVVLPDNFADEISVKTLYPAGPDKFVLAINDESFFLLELQ